MIDDEKILSRLQNIVEPSPHQEWFEYLQNSNPMIAGAATLRLFDPECGAFHELFEPFIYFHFNYVSKLLKEKCTESLIKRRPLTHLLIVNYFLAKRRLVFNRSEEEKLFQSLISFEDISMKLATPPYFVNKYVFRAIQSLLPLLEGEVILKLFRNSFLSSVEAFYAEAKRYIDWWKTDHLRSFSLNVDQDTCWRYRELFKISPDDDISILPQLTHRLLKYEEMRNFKIPANSLSFKLSGKMIANAYRIKVPRSGEDFEQAGLDLFGERFWANSIKPYRRWKGSILFLTDTEGITVGIAFVDKNHKIRKILSKPDREIDTKSIEDLFHSLA